MQILKRVLNKIAYFGPGGFTLRPQMHRLRGAKIGKNVWISQYVYLDELHPEAIILGDNCTIGLGTSIFTHFYWGGKGTESQVKDVVIEADSFVGPHCVILPGVRVGQGSVIKAGSVVTRNVPAGTFWGPPPSGPLGQVTVPLTPEYSYDEFVRGLKPLRKGLRHTVGESNEQ